jgi:hypothetical protein
MTKTKSITRRVPLDETAWGQAAFSLRTYLWKGSFHQFNTSNRKANTPLTRLTP